jgi:hypothetical protein
MAEYAAHSQVVQLGTLELLFLALVVDQKRIGPASW